MKKSKFLKSSKDMLSRSFNPSKCKTSLRLAASRLKLLRNKKEAQVKQMRREISVLLESGQDQTARIRVEHVIREEKMMAAFDLIEIYCELIVARLPIIESQKSCPIDLKEAITSVVFASPRCGDVPELVDARKQFTEKYGKEFITSAIELRPDCGVSRMLVEKLSAVAPDVQTKTKILNAIAKEHGVEWDGESIEENSTPASDLLAGPTTFVKVSEQPVEPSRSQGPDIKVPQRTSQETEKIVSARVSGVNTASQHGMRPQASGGDREHLFRGESGGVSRDRPRWNMEFKDATAAAQAAAESAEMASIAARAAADLSRRDSLTKQYSMESNKLGDHSPRDGTPETHLRSKMVSENKSFSEYTRLRNAQIDNGRYEVSRGGGKDYSHSSSLQSRASIDDDSTERYYRKNVREETFEHDVNIFSNHGQHFEHDAGESSSLGFGKEEASPKSSRGTAVVFDKSDSDTEDDGFHVSPTYDEPQKMPLSSQISHKHLSANTDSWSPSPKSSTSKIVMPPAPVSLSRKSSSSDSVSVAFDEEDTKLSSDFFGERKKPVGLQSNDKSGTSFRSPHETQTPLSSDYESEEMDSERQGQKKFDAHPPAKLKSWKPAADQPDLVPRKNLTELNSSSEREEGLDFGKLTGGLRHRGYNYPSFGRNQLDSKETIKPTAGKNTKPTSYTDSSEEEEEPLHHKHQLYPPSSGGKDLKTKPSFVASNSIFDSDNSDLDEDLPKESPSRTRRLHSGISRRTKAFPSDPEKEKLPKWQLRSEALDVDDDVDRKGSTSTSSETPKRYQTRRDSSKWGSEDYSTSVRIQTSNADVRSEAPEHKSHTPESRQQFQPSKGNSSHLRNSLQPKPTVSNSHSPVTQESKVSPKLSSAKEASMPQTKPGPPLRQGKTNSNKDSGNQKASHVHPKLPDYDSFVQFFQKNRS